MSIRRESPASSGVVEQHNLPDYPSNMARAFASDALDAMNDEPREEDRKYTLAQWFHVALKSRPDAGGGVREALADWSELPKDIYVIGAQRVNAVGYDVQCCSVPMVTVPEVRYVRADMITSAPSRPDAGGGVREVLEKTSRALEELKAIVWGECPSLLNEDSGGNARLDIDIDEALELAKATLSTPSDAVNESAEEITNPQTGEQSQ